MKVPVREHHAGYRPQLLQQQQQLLLLLLRLARLRNQSIDHTSGCDKDDTKIVVSLRLLLLLR